MECSLNTQQMPMPQYHYRITFDIKAFVSDRYDNGQSTFRQRRSPRVWFQWKQWRRPKGLLGIKYQPGNIWLVALKSRPWNVSYTISARIGLAHIIKFGQKTLSWGILISLCFLLFIYIYIYIYYSLTIVRWTTWTRSGALSRHLKKELLLRDKRFSTP